MMKKAGYFQRTGGVAYDSDSKPHEFIVLHILRQRYAIRSPDLARAIAGRIHVQVESLAYNWNYYLGQVSGLAYVSASGKALNIDLFGAGDFTVSLASLRSVQYGRNRLAVVFEIPEPQNPVRPRKYPLGQRQITALA